MLCSGVPLKCLRGDCFAGTASRHRGWQWFAAFRWVAAVLGGVLWCAAAVYAAGGGSSGNGLDSLHRQLTRIEGRLTRGEGSGSQLAGWVIDVRSVRSHADSCVSDASRNIAEISRDLSGPMRIRRGEVLQITKERELLRQQRLSLQDRLADCRKLGADAGRVMLLIGQRQRALLAAQFFGRGPALASLLRDNLAMLSAWSGATEVHLSQHSGLDQLTAPQIWALGLIAVAAVVTGMLLLRYLLHWAGVRSWGGGFSGAFGLSLTASTARYLPQLLVAAAIAAVLWAATGAIVPPPLISLAAYGLPAYFLALWCIRMFLAPVQPAAPYISIPAGTARTLAARLRILALLIFSGYLAFGALFAAGAAEGVLLLVRDAYFVVITAGILSVIWPLAGVGRLSRLKGLRIVLAAVLMAAAGAEVLGYRNLSIAVLRAVTGTLLASGILVFASRLAGEFFERLNTDKHPWHRRLRQTLDIEAGQPLPGLLWLRGTAYILLWVAFLVLLLRAWGLSDAALLEVRAFVVGGFAFGSLRVFPVRILLALVTFVALFYVSGWARVLLKKHWLEKMHLESGAHDTMLTLSGYVGTSIAILVALSVAGLGLSNLAIIAGALSVGIGFGLQNIVNNFVSGLILLFERPIKTGDWVVVGGTEGYVRQIRIRSTQIQTFDRADVIVPNSELISGQVTNWMFHDPRGRVRVQVGVAYGSDTGFVKELLTTIGSAHPLVIRDDPERPVTVYFLSFGDSALNFELQCHIGHIAQRQQVISDLNFSIDSEFRRHMIEMPFPQRDIHVRDLPAGWPAPESPGRTGPA